MAATIGNERALEVYKNLLTHTRDSIKDLSTKKFLFYSHFVDKDDMWDNTTFVKSKQSEGHLGHRMKEAFRSVLMMENKAVIIGSDCPEINEDIIKQALEALDESDLVIGPSTDGGYYLLGMKELHVELFRDISWSTDSVLPKTLSKAQELELKVHLLPELHDIDTEEDLKKFPSFYV